MRHPVIEADMQAILDSRNDWSMLSGAKIVVTGAAGFLPAYMVEVALTLNERQPKHSSTVIGLVRNLPRAQERFRHYDNRSDLVLIEHDVCNPPPDIGNIDFVIHAASQASPKYYKADPVGTIGANTTGTDNMLRLAHVGDARGVLFFSSGEVYGSTPRATPTAEDDYGPVDPLEPRNCYAESKRLGESLCVAWHKQFGVPVTIVRPFHTYGPGMQLNDGRVFADFVNDAIHGRAIVLKSDGVATRSFCYLADAVAGFFSVLLEGQPAQAYNIGNDRAECSVANLAHLLATLHPDRTLPVIRKRRTIDDPYMPSKLDRSCPNVARARALGWNPTTSLGDGFRRTLRSFE